jgi:hypothetical protein
VGGLPDPRTIWRSEYRSKRAKPGNCVGAPVHAACAVAGGGVGADIGQSSRFVFCRIRIRIGRHSFIFSPPLAITSAKMESSFLSLCSVTWNLSARRACSISGTCARLPPSGSKRWPGSRAARVRRPRPRTVKVKAGGLSRQVRIEWPDRRDLELLCKDRANQENREDKSLRLVGSPKHHA